MTETELIERLLNTNSIKNILDNDIILKFEVILEWQRILVVKMYLDTTMDELKGDDNTAPGLSREGVQDKLWYNYNLDPAWWQAFIIPNRVLKLLFGSERYRNIILFIVDRNGHHLLTEQ